MSDLIDVMLVDEYNADVNATAKTLAQKYSMKYGKVRKMLIGAGIPLKRGVRKGATRPREVLESVRQARAQARLTRRMSALIQQHGFDSVAAAYNAAVDGMESNAQ